MPRGCVRLSGDAYGAVFVEKLIVYLPLLAAFFMTWDLAELGAAHLVVQRASAAAGRAAVVVLPDDPAFYEGQEVDSYEGARRADVELAAGMVLSANPRLRADFDVELDDVPAQGEPLSVTVRAHYDCGTVSFFCGRDGGLALTATTVHTYQGSRYAYSTPPGDVGGQSAALSAGGGGRLRAKGTPPPGGRTSPGANQNAGCGDCKPKPKSGPPGPAAKCRYLYRSDGRPSGDVFANGMSAWGSNRDIYDHVEGSRMKESAYVATTYDEKTAYRLYWQTSKSARKNRCIYKIRDCGCGYDVGDELNRCRKNLTPQQQKDVDKYAYQKEVVIAGKIRGEDIVSVTCPSDGDEPAEAAFPGAPPTQPEPPQAPDANASWLAKLKYKSALKKYEKAMKKYEKDLAAYQAKLDAYTNWPPEDAVKARGTTTQNVAYDGDDSARKSRPCE